jgi:hypothetical protein
MNKFAFVAVIVFGFSASPSNAQQPIAEKPDPPVPHERADAYRGSSYSPPTQAERFTSYLRHTLGIASFLEAGVRGGIQQARNTPSQWGQGGDAYAERFGSSFGHIAIRGTTEYLLADVFKEDIRFISRSSSNSTNPSSKFKAALADTFLARKGDDGHNAFSIARLAGPVAASAIAVSAWYPSGYGRAEIAREVGISFGFQFARNFLRELAAH